MCLITAFKESKMSETRRLHVNETNGIYKSLLKQQQQQQQKSEFNSLKLLHKCLFCFFFV